MRALETGQISSKYDNPEFTVFIKGEADATQNNLTGHSKTIRVFNEDFVRENLKFIANPDDDIKSFAVLGSNNAVIEAEIAQLESELGKDEPENKTGLFENLHTANALYLQKKSAFDTAKELQEKVLDTKATDRNTGIKYNSERFGDQNYTKAKLLQDIAAVQKTTFSLLSTTQYAELDQLITEKVTEDIKSVMPPEFKIGEFNLETIDVLQRKIGNSGKIEELVQNAMLNSWVATGKKLHEDRDKCAFCDNEISTERWKELENHFDEELANLEKDVATLLQLINKEKAAVTSLAMIGRERYYSRFQQKASSLAQLFAHYQKKYLEQLTYLVGQLEIRKQSPMTSVNCESALDYSGRIKLVYKLQERLRTKSNTYSTQLSKDQAAAKNQLRFKEVHEFIETIQYATNLASIGIQENEAQDQKTVSDGIRQQIKDKQTQIKKKKRLLNDEEKGATKVNEYLNNFFGHDFLKLQSVDEMDDQGQAISVRFEIIRDNKKAHHLSEGECSLIAFCYFMAKLDDIHTKGSKPVIWIDDPISSLDGNHIFFIYSLINTEIVAKLLAEQLLSQLITSIFLNI